MKKYLIFLSTFLFLFGLSVAFAGIYIEDFEDGVLDVPEWSANGDYDITNFPGGSKGLHMNRTCDDCGGHTQVSTNTKELIYHFAADIYLSTSNPWADVEIMQWREGGESFELWTGIYFNAETGNLYLAVNLYDSNGQWIDQLSESLGPYNAETWYSLSITINDGYVTFGIDGNETNLIHELIQRPDSGFCDGRVAVWSDDDDGYVDYWVDNLVAYTSTDPTKDTILSFFDDSVEAGTIVGSGNNPRLANRRLSLFRQMLERAISFIENDMIEAAYRTLNRALLFCDGEPHPPDYIEGEAVPQLRGMIEHLMGYFTDDDGDGLSEYQGDCNDTDDTIYPGAPEVCDSQDNQCPGDSGYGDIDEGCLTDVQVGGHSYYECRNQNYWIHFQAIDPEHIADSVTVTGPGIDGSLSLTYVDYAPGTWGTYSWFSLGNNLPAPPPLTYTFHIESNGTIYPMDFILQGFNEECVTNLSPTGSVSGDITFSWTGISSPDARYLVELNEYGTGVGIWQSASTENTSIVYNGLPLPTGSHYSFVVYAQDSYGNYSTAMADFVYGGVQEETYLFERMWPELESPWYFNSPAYVATDKNDLVYISDYSNNQIQVFTANGDLVSKWPITKYGDYDLHLPRAITVDQDGFVYVVAYVSNIGSSILKLNPSGEIVDKIGSYADTPGTCGFSNPCAIDVDNSGNLYVTDEVNQRIEKLAPDGSLITTWGSLGSEPGQFHDPTGIAVDRKNNWVYVLDSRNLRTQKFTTEGEYLTQWQSMDSVTDFGGVGIAVDQQGYVYVSNTLIDEIRKFTDTGELEATFIDIAYGSYGIAIDSGGYIYSADFHGNRVEKISPDGLENWIWTSAGIENGYFHAPVDVALDSNKNVYVADYVNARIQKFDSLGNFISTWEPSCIPQSIATDASDNVYVMCGSFVSKYDANGGLITEWGSQGTGDGQFSEFNNGIAVDYNGFVYTVDAGNHRIQKFTSDGTFVTKWGSQGTGNGQFMLPWAIEVDSNGNVYVTDSDQHNVQIFTTDGVFVDKWEEQGFGAPRGIAVDESNNVYVCSAKGYIHKLTSEGVLITEFGDSGSEPGYIAGPNGIEVDSTERIYVADSNNNRIQVFTKVSP